MQFLRRTLLAAATAFLASGATAMEPEPFQEALRELPESGAPAQLKALQDLRYRWLLESFPESATFQGYPGFDDRWVDDSAEGIGRRQEQTRRMLSASRRGQPSGRTAAE